jgi:hypothetical protein
VIALYVAAYLWLFWYAFVLVMGLYRAHLDKRLTPVTYVLASPAVLVGVVMDVFANIFIATFVFWEIPTEWLVTQRLIRLKRYNDWRGVVARYVCSDLLDPLDPTGSHCE